MKISRIIKVCMAACLSFMLVACSSSSSNRSVSIPDTKDIQKIQDRGVLRVGVKKSVPGFSEKKDGKYQGLEADLAKKLADDLGVDVQYTSVTPTSRETLLKNGKIPESEVLKTVDKVLSAEDIRPFTDKVEVNAPIAQKYSINIKWWLSKEDDVTAVTSSVNKAVEEYKKWQKEKLGRDINPNKLIQLLIQAGAKRVEVVSPVFTKIEKTHVAQDTATEIHYQGEEDE